MGKYDTGVTGHNILSFAGLLTPWHMELMRRLVESDPRPGHANCPGHHRGWAELAAWGLVRPDEDVLYRWWLTSRGYRVYRLRLQAEELAVAENQGDLCSWEGESRGG